MNQLPDPIDAADIAENPEILPGSPLLVEFSSGLRMHAFSGDATAEDGGEEPAVQLTFVDQINHGSAVVVLNLDDLEALGAVVDRLLDEIDPPDPAAPDPEAGAGGVVP